MKSKAANFVLIVSLGINLLLVGAAIGFFLKTKPGPKFPGHLANLVQDVAPQMSTEKRAEIQSMLRDSRKEGRILHQSMRAQHSAINTAVLKEPFDEHAVEEAFARSRDDRAKIQAHMHNQIITIMKTLPSEQRVELLKHLFRPKRHKENREPPKALP